MRALVLGGTSFVGGRVTRALLAGGHDVSVLNRGRNAEPPEGAQLLIADRKDPGSVRAVLEGTEWDAVFDVSGFVMATDIDSFTQLVDGLVGSVGRYVYVSSIMAYEPTGFMPWREDDPVRDQSPERYGGFKVAAERVLMERHASDGFPATVVRPAAIYGPDNNIYDMEAAMFLRLRAELPVLLPHDGLVTTSYGHVDDLAETMLVAAEHPRAVGEIFNVSGEGVSAQQYVQSLGDIVGVEPQVVPVGREELARAAGQICSHLFLARHHGILDVDKAQEILGTPPGRDFVTGHRQTYEWFMDSGLADVESAADPLWGAGFDFAAEQHLVDGIRGSDLRTNA